MNKKLLYIFKQINKIRNGIVPIFFIELDKNEYKKQIKGSCNVKPNPILFRRLTDTEKEVFMKNINECIDLLRSKIINIDKDC